MWSSHRSTIVIVIISSSICGINISRSSSSIPVEKSPQWTERHRGHHRSAVHIINIQRGFHTTDHSLQLRPVWLRAWSVLLDGCPSLRHPLRWGAFYYVHLKDGVKGQREISWAAGPADPGALLSRHSETRREVYAAKYCHVRGDVWGHLCWTAVLLSHSWRQFSSCLVGQEQQQTLGIIIILLLLVVDVILSYSSNLNVKKTPLQLIT